MISFWASSFKTQRALWFSSVANTNLWFTFAKAIFSILKGTFLNRRAAVQTAAFHSAVLDNRVVPGFMMLLVNVWIQLQTATACTCGRSELLCARHSTGYVKRNRASSSSYVQTSVLPISRYAPLHPAGRLCSRLHQRARAARPRRPSSRPPLRTSGCRYARFHRCAQTCIRFATPLFPTSSIFSPAPHVCAAANDTFMKLIIQHRCRAAIMRCRPAPQSLVLAILVCAFLIGIWRLVIDGILRSTWNYRWGARSNLKTSTSIFHNQMCCSCQGLWNWSQAAAACGCHPAQIFHQLSRRS